jgi:hypothetical protein
LSLVVGLFLPLVVTGAASSEEPKPSRKVRVEAGVGGTFEEGEPYIKANRAIVERVLPESCRACARTTPPEGAVDFELIVSVGKNGKPAAVKTEPKTEFTSCVAKALVGAIFTEPPRVPLDVYFDLSFD